MIIEELFNAKAAEFERHKLCATRSPRERAVDVGLGGRGNVGGAYVPTLVVGM